MVATIEGYNLDFSNIKNEDCYVLIDLPEPIKYNHKKYDYLTFYISYFVSNDEYVRIGGDVDIVIDEQEARNICNNFYSHLDKFSLIHSSNIIIERLLISDIKDKRLKGNIIHAIKYALMEYNL